MSHCMSAVLYVDPIVQHISKKSINDIYLLYYCKICASNNYAPQMSYLCHIQKLHDVHQWGKHANTHATHELTGINHVTRSTVHGHQWWQWWWQCKMMMMPQPDYIYWVGHLVKSVKMNLFLPQANSVSITKATQELLINTRDYMCAHRCMVWTCNNKICSLYNNLQIHTQKDNYKSANKMLHCTKPQSSATSY